MSYFVFFDNQLLVIYVYVSFSRLITSVGGERANCSAIVYLNSCGFCSEGFRLPLDAWDRLSLFYFGTSWAFHLIILTGTAIVQVLVYCTLQLTVIERINIVYVLTDMSL